MAHNTVIDSSSLLVRYLSSNVRRVAAVPFRRRSRSSYNGALPVNSTRLVAVSDRAIPVSAAAVWNKWFH